MEHTKEPWGCAGYSTEDLLRHPEQRVKYIIEENEELKKQRGELQIIVNDMRNFLKSLT